MVMVAMACALSQVRVCAQNKEYGFPKHEHEHEHKGTVFVGGALTYWNNTKNKSVLFEFEPEFGYLFNNTWGVGMMLGYEYNKEKHGTGAAAHNHISHEFKISPFARYYYFHREPFNLYIDGGFGFNFAKEEGKVKNRGFEIGLRPGACIDLTEGLCLCMHLGFIGYRKDYFSAHKDGIGHEHDGENGLNRNGFGFRIAPEEVSIGLEIEF